MPDAAQMQAEMLARFEAQVASLVEESLGPLLASNGALDPATARAIARQTSACAVLRATARAQRASRSCACELLRVLVQPCARSTALRARARALACVALRLAVAASVR